jgi:hypothetical protein
MQIYDSWLSELMKGFIVEVKKFNELFVSQPAHYISINTGMHQGHSSMGVIIENFLDGIEGETITKLRERLVAPMQMIHPDTEVTLNSSFGLFKKGAIKHRFGASFSIEVFFTNVKYDVFITDNFGDVDRCPDITEQLKIILAKNESIDKIYFDKNGLGYLEERLNKKNGKYYINDEEIRSIYTREDILNDKIRSNGMVRYREERLLHKPLKPEEIKELCKTLSTNIYEHIDFYTRKYGIR